MLAMITCTINPHAQFCCSTHGCRFGDKATCPVACGDVKQINLCGFAAICSEYIGHSRYAKNAKRSLISRAMLGKAKANYTSAQC